jgi:peptide/nickel transport system substrate-binding protein
VARGAALAAALAASLLAVSGAGGAPAQTPKRGGTVVIAEPEHLEPGCLNPFVDSCEQLRYLGGVLAGAFRVTPGPTYQPGLATGRVTSRKPHTLVYDIRREARWSDGIPVTARDFEFTHQAILRYRPQLEIDHLARVRSVRKLDAKTVRVVLRTPWADWRNLFDVVLPRHALVGRDLASLWKGAIDNPKTGVPIGSGPFLVDRLDRGRQLVLRRNPRYWGEHLAFLDRIVYRFTTPGDAADAMRRGEVDMINPGPRLFQAEALELRRQPEPGVRVVAGLDPAWEHLDIQLGPNGHPALRDRRVRQALAYGIDRREIVRVVSELTGDRTTQTEPLDSVVSLANSSRYQPNWRRYRHRPELARRLLVRAGCHLGADRIYICAGVRLSLRLRTSAGSEHRRRSAELARDHLRRIGVEVDLSFVPPTFLGPSIESRDWDLFQFGWIVATSAAGPLDVYGCQQANNHTGYCDRLVTGDLDQATRILDDRRRFRLLNKVDARLATAVPAIPLYQTMSLLAYRATVRNLVPNGEIGFPWNAEDWWLDR